jgi:energy-coupling factor transport system permease protein
VPTALYEVSVAVTVGLTLAPQLALSARSVRRARALRGAPVRGRHAIRMLLVPVLEEAFERSMHLAATMDARGYGRAGDITAGQRRVTGALMLAGMLGLAVGAYGLLDSTAPDALGVPALLTGVLLSAAGLRLASRRLHRTRYRPPRWDARAIAVALSGAAAVVAVVLVQALGTADARLLVPVTTPLSFPGLPLVPAVAVLGALAPLLLVRAGAR